MDGFVTEPTIEEQDCLNQASKIKTLKDPPDNFDSYLSLADSFLDFDSIKEFFENIPPNPDRNCLEKIEFGVVGKSLKMSEEEKTDSHGSDLVFDGSGCMVKESNSSCIEEEMGKVSLVGVKGEMMNGEDVSGKVGSVGGMDLVTVNGSGVKSEMVNDENESESSSESEEESSSSSSSSTSSSSDEEEEQDKEEEKEVKMEVKGGLNVAGELEEGEIEGVDGEETVRGTDDDDDEAEEGEVAMVRGSDAEFDFIGDEDEDGDGGGGGAGGPIKSKNEVQVLPSVPRVDVTLRPEHRMLPVGVVLSVLGAQVIVEGVEKHNPLNEGSILWITESRSPLGLIDEIFGPVKNPYYVVRYNSDSEVPAGIHVGTSISFVEEFADHVLNDKNLYKKGYDASGENDEEISEEAEFSDDEKEAEYKRKLKMEKRGMTDQKPGNRKNNRKKVRNRDGRLQKDRQSVQQMEGAGRLQQNQVQHQVSSVPEDHGNCSSSSAVGQGFIGGTGLVAQFLPVAQMAGFGASFNEVWTNGIPSQQPQSAVFPGGFQSNGAPWLPQNYQQHPNQMPMMNGMPFMQQFDPSGRSLPNVALPGGQPNFFAGPTNSPWLGLVGQNGLNQMMGMAVPGPPGHPTVNGGLPGLNQTIGMAFQGQPAPQSTNAGKKFQPPEAPQQFNMGASSSRGRKPYHRGGGRFAGGRGRGHSK